MSVSPQSGAMGLERLIWLKYNTVMKMKSTFNQGSTLPKIRVTSEKASNKNYLELNFVQKSP